MNPLLALQNFGQSVWLDFIRRSVITSGELARYLEEDGLRGVTSNPAIFEKAITGSTDYTNALRALWQTDRDGKAIYEQLAIRDIQDAADLLWAVYEKTSGRDGYVSLEVAPTLARDTRGTVEEGRRLWKAVGRDNLMIKVPGTEEGMPAIQQLISEGINVNVTLLFARESYVRAAEAYLAGLETLVARGGDPTQVASVASFFVSRIDSAVDALVVSRLRETRDDTPRALLKRVLGKVAIANAKLAYQLYGEIFSGKRWNALLRRGARTQRLLWASTGTKNPQYSDVLYVEELIGPDTVNTMPPSTLEAFRDHGRLRASLTEDLPGARQTPETLERLGISLKQVTDQLLVDAVKLFAEPFEKLLRAVDPSCRPVPAAVRKGQTHEMPGELAAAVRASIDDWKATQKIRRLWSRDASLWTGTDEGRWMGWLRITEDQLAHVHHLSAIGEEVRAAGFSHALLLGMGGSSLCPEVLKKTFGKQGHSPELHVLDSTDPAQIRAAENGVDLSKTLFIVSSKSGTTLEPNILMQYFFDRVQRAVGAGRAGDRFIAITDPGSRLQGEAETRGFRRIFSGRPDIGGRYSALSDFGMVPAAIASLDLRKFLDQAEVMVHACASCVPVEQNPAVELGSVLGELAARGRDKVTLVMSPGLKSLGAWLEQLLAESTGKNGKGLIPVDQEPLGAPEVYGTDRVFVYTRLASAPDREQDAKIEALWRAEQPVVRIEVAGAYDLGQEFFRWEMATAVAGSILGINVFDQPDVEASKVATRELTTQYEKTGSLPPESPVLQDGPFALLTDEKNARALAEAAGGDRSLVSYLRAHLNSLAPGDYFALLAYLEMKPEHERLLQELRQCVRDSKRVATCLGFGPRFLHSTGQAYKGGPNTGVFLQITCTDAADLAVPGQQYTFGVVKAAQARGDFEVLAERGRRVLRVHIGKDVIEGLTALLGAIRKALVSAGQLAS